MKLPHNKMLPHIPSERTKPVLILDLPSKSGGKFTCALSENDIVLVCGWGNQCEPAVLAPFETSGVQHDCGRSYRWSRTDYYVNLKSDVIPRFSSLIKMVEHEKVVIFALPGCVSETMIGRLRKIADTILITRQQIRDHEGEMLGYLNVDDVTHPVDFRKGIEESIQHIHELKAKLKALYAKDLEEVLDGI